jgi:translation initiation factor IF-3
VRGRVGIFYIRAHLFLFFIFFIYCWGCLTISTSAKGAKGAKDLACNEQIRAAQIRVIGDSGEQLGIMKTKDALDMALNKGLDLVEIAPTAEVPVCRIMDYGKYKFEKSKKDKEAKKKQKQIIIETKEIQLSSRIDTHDFNTRLGQTRKFIEAGNKVKVCLELGRGRELAHTENGYKLLEKFEHACLEFSVVEKRPVREGRRVTMFLAPKKAEPVKREPKPEPAVVSAVSAASVSSEKSEGAETPVSGE